MTDNEVFRALCKRSVCACPHCDVTSIPTLVNILNASYYSVRKCIKSLETKGLVVLAFDGGIDDEGYVRCYKGYQVTETGTDTDIFQEEYFGFLLAYRQEHVLQCSFIWDISGGAQRLKLVSCQRK